MWLWEQDNITTSVEVPGAWLSSPLPLGPASVLPSPLSWVSPWPFIPTVSAVGKRVDRGEGRLRWKHSWGGSSACLPSWSFPDWVRHPKSGRALQGGWSHPSHPPPSTRTPAGKGAVKALFSSEGTGWVDEVLGFSSSQQQEVISVFALFFRIVLNIMCTRRRKRNRIEQGQAVWKEKISRWQGSPWPFPSGAHPKPSLPLQWLSWSSLPLLSSTLPPSDLESRSPCLLLPPSSSLPSLWSEAPLCKMLGLWEGVTTQAKNSLWLGVLVRRGKCGVGQGQLVPLDSTELFLNPEVNVSLSFLLKLIAHSFIHPSTWSIQEGFIELLLLYQWAEHCRYRDKKNCQLGVGGAEGINDPQYIGLGRRGSKGWEGGSGFGAHRAALALAVRTYITSGLLI